MNAVLTERFLRAPLESGFGERFWRAFLVSALGDRFGGSI